MGFFEKNATIEHMNIAIHSADLSDNRVDGTRVYLLHMLKQFGLIEKGDTFFLYHAKKFNKELKPPVLDNYHPQKTRPMPLWTQISFAHKLWTDNPEVLWMPLANIPLVRKKNLKTVVTIHDLAFNHFPEYFTRKDLFKLKALAFTSIHLADKIIAVSQSTKNDIVRFYPTVSPEKIKVIHHGFDGELFNKTGLKESEGRLLWEKYSLEKGKYILYVGAIQPRKNLKTLVDAFELIARRYFDMKLVIAGEKAWMWQETIRHIKKSEFRERIILTGPVPFVDLSIFYRAASVFSFPSLYEGFGIPVLEAFASGVPVVAAQNSSLLEIGEGAALFHKTHSAEDLAEKLDMVLDDEKKRAVMVKLGRKKCKEFSWKKCAKETLGYIKE